MALFLCVSYMRCDHIYYVKFVLLLRRVTTVLYTFIQKRRWLIGIYTFILYQSDQCWCCNSDLACRSIAIRWIISNTITVFGVAWLFQRWAFSWCYIVIIMGSLPVFVCVTSCTFCVIGYPLNYVFCFRRYTRVNWSRNKGIVICEWLRALPMLCWLV